MANSVGSLSVLASPMPTCTIYSLCDDVLLAIFLTFHEACLTYYEAEALYDSLYTTRTSPWLLSHVCQHWRALIISSPLLWTHIHLNMDNYIENFSGLPLGLETFLHRSKDLELCVEIQDPQERYLPNYTPQTQLDGMRECTRSLIRLLCPTTARWRHLEVATASDIIEAFMACSFERLRSFDFYFYWDRDFAITFRHAHKLVELTFVCQEELWSFDLPWAGIHTFYSGCSGLLYLPSMITLQTLHIEEGCGCGESVRHITSGELESTGFFELPLLRTITVNEGIKNRDIYELSRRLRAPSLTTLVIYMWDHEQAKSPVSPPPPPRLPVFNNMDLLENLSLYFVLSTPIDTIPFLTRASSVKSLYLGPNAATPAVMEAIGLGVVPRLQTLGLHFSSWKKYSESVISMVTCRALNRPIANLMFARFGQYDDLAREQRDGWDRWSSREALRIRKRSSARWRLVLELVDVKIVERYTF